MVLTKLIIFLVLIYFIGKSARNLVRAALHDPKAQSHIPPRHDAPQAARWQGPSPEKANRRDPNVEDAKWVDL